MSEADIKILENKLKQWEPYKNTKFPTPIEKEIQKENRAIENLLNKYKEQEKMIELMAKGLFDYANLGVLIDCPAEYDGIRDLRSCPKDKKCLKCIIECFEKKAKGE